VIFLSHKNDLFLAIFDYIKIYTLYKSFHKNFMQFTKKIKKTLICISLFTLIASCNGKLPGGDARKFPADPAKRVEQNIKEGRGFTINEAMKGSRGGVFEFATSNELWRASLDTIEFMPLISANYSGGIIITDWYSAAPNQSIKITLRFLSNEIRSDALDIKIFRKDCNSDQQCTVSEINNELNIEIKKEILKKATLYKAEEKKDN